MLLNSAIFLSYLPTEDVLSWQQLLSNSSSLECTLMENWCSQQPWSYWELLLLDTILLTQTLLDLFSFGSQISLKEYKMYSQQNIIIRNKLQHSRSIFTSLALDFQSCFSWHFKKEISGSCMISLLQQLQTMDFKVCFWFLVDSDSWLLWMCSL